MERAGSRQRSGTPVSTRARPRKLWTIDWEERLDRKALLDRGRDAEVAALIELYDRYGLRLLLSEERLPEPERRVLILHIAGSGGGDGIAETACAPPGAPNKEGRAAIGRARPRGHDMDASVAERGGGNPIL